MTLRNRQPRAGLTLLEVVVAMAIFLISLVAIWQLVLIGSDRALDVKLQARTSAVCQSKLAEAIIGPNAPQETSGYANCLEPGDENLLYKLEVSGVSEVENVYEVRVWVKHEIGSRVFESHLSQMVLNPAIRGSTLDPPVLAPKGTETTDPMTDPNAPTTPTTPDPAGGGGGGGGGAKGGGGGAKGGGGAQGGGKGGGAQGGGKGGAKGGPPGGGKGGGPQGGGKGAGGGKGGGGPQGGGGKGGGGGGPQGGGGGQGGGKGAVIGGGTGGPTGGAGPGGGAPALGGGRGGGK